MNEHKYFSVLQLTLLGMIAGILAIQIYGLVLLRQLGTGVLGGHIWNCFVATLILAVLAISIYLAKEKAGRETSKKAYVDVTGVQNKRACMEKINQLDKGEDTYNVAVAIFDLNNLKRINDLQGHEKGDELIIGFAGLLLAVKPEHGFLARFGGDEFMMIMEETSDEQVMQMMEALKKLTNEYNMRHKVKISYAYGYELSNREHYYLMEQLVERADRNMYENKRACKENNENGYDELDSLTGLLSNDAFVRRAGGFLHMIKEGRTLVLACSDVSNFRYINDNFGYQTGNILLKTLADEISDEEGLLCAARVFSDNFVYLLDMTGKSRDEIVHNLLKWNRTMTKKIQNQYKGSYFAINTGLYFIKQSHEKMEDMIHYSNTARKLAKDHYGQILIYSEKLEKKEKLRTEILVSFQEALNQGEFQVYLQPQIAGTSGQLYGAEALVRWMKKDGTICNPDEFISVLEQSGDIIKLDYYVYEKVFQWLHGRIKQGLPLIMISMNVSRIHLYQSDEFIRTVEGLLKQYEIPPEYIMFEITESVYIRNVEEVGVLIERLHNLNIRVSMDDFGSGYSSLKILKSLAFDEIKIDKEFLSNGMSSNGKIVLCEIIHLIKRLKKSVVCEGVETEEEVLFLQKEKCDILQGYYFSKPIAIPDFESRLLDAAAVG